MAKIYPEYRDEVRRKVVAAAHEVFHSKGYRDATMSDIATALGVTKPTIYHYFGGKEEIFAAVAEYERKLLEAIIVEVFRNRDFMTGVEVFFDTFMTTHLEKIGPESIGMATKDKKLQEIINRDREAFLAIIEQFLSQRQEIGEIRGDADPRTLACAVDALFNGLLIYIMQGMDVTRVKQVWVDSVRRLTQAP